jgi:hypothetical protein
VGVHGDFPLLRHRRGVQLSLCFGRASNPERERGTSKLGNGVTEVGPSSKATRHPLCWGLILAGEGRGQPWREGGLSLSGRVRHGTRVVRRTLSVGRWITCFYMTAPPSVNGGASPNLLYSSYGRIDEAYVDYSKSGPKEKRRPVSAKFSSSSKIR